MLKLTKSGMRKRIGFTLLELLIVISIIMILMSMLMPVLKKTREKTKTISCASNLRQVGAGTISYSFDYGNFLPFGYVAGGGRSGYGDASIGTWYCLTAPYLNIKTYSYTTLGSSSTNQLKGPCLYTCPSQSFTYPNWAPVSYSPPTTVAFGVTIKDTPKTTMGSLAMVVRPSEKAWLGETVQANLGPFFNPYRIGDTVVASGYDARHEGGGNILFMDFHVAWRSLVSCLPAITGASIVGKGIFDTYDRY